MGCFGLWVDFRRSKPTLMETNRYVNGGFLTLCSVGKEELLLFNNFGSYAGQDRAHEFPHGSIHYLAVAWTSF